MCQMEMDSILAPFNTWLSGVVSVERGKDYIAFVSGDCRHMPSCPTFDDETHERVM